MASALRLRGLRAGREEITHTHEAVVRSFAVTWGGSDGAAAAAMVELTGQLLNRREATRRGRSVGLLPSLLTLLAVRAAAIFDQSYNRRTECFNLD